MSSGKVGTGIFHNQDSEVAIWSYVRKSSVYRVGQYIRPTQGGGSICPLFTITQRHHFCATQFFMVHFGLL